MIAENIKSVYDAAKVQETNCKNAPAFLYAGKSFSYSELIKSVDILADALLLSGVKQGSVITLCLPNIPQTVYCFYAAAKIGAVCHFLHALSGAPQIKSAMQKTSSKHLFVFSLLAQNIVPHFDASDIKIVSCSPAGELGFIKKTLFSLKNPNPSDVCDYTAFCQSAAQKNSVHTESISKASASYTGKETVALLDSGGTTGIEKTIELSSFAINSLCATTKTILNHSSLHKKYMLAVLPLFHGFGLAMGLHSMIFNGGCSVLLPKFSRNQVIKYLKKGQINFMIGVPAIYNALLAHKDFKGKCLSSIKSAFVGGDFVAQSLLDEFNRRLKENGSDGRLFEGYGLTETVTVVSVNTITDSKEKTVGHPLEDIKISTFFTSALKPLFPDMSYPDNSRLPDGLTGEICVSGPTLMNGYYKDADATSETFITDEYGTKWVRTGDCGYVDSEGYVVFRQRLKRIIKVSGENVFPAQIEQVASAISEVSQVCAFPVDDIKKGSVVHLAIESATTNPQELAEKILSTLRTTVSPPSVPQKVHILTTFPQTKFNKIDLPALKEIINNSSAYTTP